MWHTRFYRIWVGMKWRYLDTDYRRPVRACGRWQEFAAFKEDMYDSYLAHVAEHGEANTTIDRIDNAKGYYKENCRWATRKQQADNRSSTRLIEIDGVTKPRIEWIRASNVSISSVRRRELRGWSFENAVKLPTLDRGIKVAIAKRV